jgi:hypothetical protein
LSLFRYNGHAPAFYAAHVPQAAGLSIRAKTFVEAVEAARDAITLEFREKYADEVAEALKKPVMLTAARVSMAKRPAGSTARASTVAICDL